MKSLILAAGALLIGATAASAQYYPSPSASPWARDRHPYAQRHHATCQEKAFRLNGFERRAGADGRLDRRERWIMRDLQRDLDRTCGRFRWRG